MNLVVDADRVLADLKELHERHGHLHLAIATSRMLFFTDKTESFFFL